MEKQHVVAFASAPSYGIDMNWYTNTGTTYHITNDLDHLSMHEQYTGHDQVQTAGGTGLSIHHICHSHILTPNKTLNLKNVLHVPSANKNLLSVHHFTMDNDVFLEFHPGHFFVKD